MDNHHANPTYEVLLRFLSLLITFDFGLNADISKNGDLICMLPRGAYRLPRISGSRSVAF